VWEFNQLLVLEKANTPIEVNKDTTGCFYETTVGNRTTVSKIRGTEDHKRNPYLGSRRKISKIADYLRFSADYENRWNVITYSVRM
jgi:hypothetical protein